MRYLRVKNWAEFQHYKDRNPPWIKLHVALLDDYDFNRLPDIHKGHLLMLWLFASKNDGKLPADPKFLQAKLGLDKAPDLDYLLDSGWLLEDDGENASTEKWASRYVSDELRAKLLDRAQHKCQACGSGENLEIDHITPVSKGGTGDEDNLQVLCRPCNRRKRVRSNSYVAAEQVATQDRKASVALARSQETEKRREETEALARQFETFWQAYPRKVAKPDALKAWGKLGLTNGDFEKVMVGLERARKSVQWQDAQYIPHPTTWLKQRRFEDADPEPVKQKVQW